MSRLGTNVPNKVLSQRKYVKQIVKDISTVTALNKKKKKETQLHFSIFIS